MRISICIPHYNRIEVLLKNLDYISRQEYPDVEVIVSDDCSSDTTKEEIATVMQDYPFTLLYHRFEENQGYDRNLRKSIELSSGEYCVVIGNDDTIYGEKSLQFLADFLQHNNLPDIGYCNYYQGEVAMELVERALETKVHGHGIECALKHVNGFSFVGGIIFKRSAFLQHNTEQYDGSIYSQMYLALYMVAKGCVLFTIREPLVLKDLQFKDGTESWSPVKNALPKTWSGARKMISGLHSVLHVLVMATSDAGKIRSQYVYSIMKRMYSVTFPYWIFQYKHHGNYYTALGLIREMQPGTNEHFKKLNAIQQWKIRVIFAGMSMASLLIPFGVFTSLQPLLYKWVRR